MSPWVYCLPFALNATLNLSIFLSTTRIHKFGLTKVTATITPVDSESQNYVDGKVETSIITITQVRKSTDENWEDYPYKPGMYVFIFE